MLTKTAFIWLKKY